MILMVVFIPLFSSLLIGFFGSYLGFKGSKIFVCLFISINVINSIFLMNEVLVNNNMILMNLTKWFELGLLFSNFCLKIDFMSAIMVFLMSLVSLVVHLFSCSYMDYDPHLPSFLSYLSLFTCFMNVLVLSSNFVQLFMGWEGVGLCSYLLMNFWFTSIQANKSAVKAMVVNKMGDMGLMISFIIIWLLFGTFEFSEMFLCMNFCENNLFLCLSAVLLIMGVMGKSSQIGLHMWLPDAMEGPTPVSALMHAATMVTAGVFLIIRVSPLLEKVPLMLLMMVLIGSVTCFFSATMGVVQNDLKKVMAYSTCSQLGYMVMICGFSYYGCGLFHLINHGFFKALLFLSAGSMIHSLADNQDMSFMGGVKQIMPVSYMFLFFGSLSLMGLPFLSGFYSKDLLMELMFNDNKFYFCLLLGLVSMFLTSFYSFSLMFMMFYNHPNLSKFEMESSHENGIVMISSLSMLFLFSMTSGYFLNYLFLGDMMPLSVININKFSPLMINFCGVGLSIVFIYLLSQNWILFFNKFLKKFYYFFMFNWFFDFIFNYYMVTKVFDIGYTMNYKLMDNQIMEHVGPYKALTFMKTLSNTLSKFYLGKISGYMFLFMLFSLVFLFKM